jgi:hypothetical protein
MKKIYYLFCLILLAFTTACTYEEEDLFDDSSANRADAAINANIEILTGSSNGWLMEYFPASMQEYGGYNILLAFDKEGVVKVAGEIADPSEVVTSLYSVKQSAGLVLSFDTYNETFHFFSDPSDPSGLGGTGFGLEGDYDFFIMEASAEKVTLKGKKAGGIAILTPMQDSWSSFISNIQNADKVMSFSKFELDLNGVTIPVSISYRTLTFTYEENGDTKSQTASYVITETGYKFYKPIIINGITLTGFTFDPTNLWFTENENSGIKLIPVIPPLNEQFVAGNWYIAYSGLGSFAGTYFNYCKVNYIDKLGETLRYAFIGSSLYGRFGFNFNCDGYTGLLGLNYTLIDENKISLVFNFTGSGDGVWYHNNAGFNYLLNPFGYSAARIFTLTTDEITSPTYITLTEDANPTANVITLYKTQITYPFDN